MPRGRPPMRIKREDFRRNRKDVKTSYYCASDEECLIKARPDFL